VIPKEGVTYDALHAAVFNAVTWDERQLRWHESRYAPSSDGTEGWALEATCSCLASSGDEVGVCYRVEAGLYKLTHGVKAPGFNPCLSSDFLVSSLCFQIQLVPLRRGPRAGHGGGGGDCSERAVPHPVPAALA
jgi:hypothetical protein